MPLNISQVFTGATSFPNAYSGTPISFLPRQSVMSIYATSDVANAGNVDTLSLTLNQGGATQQPIPPGYAIGVSQWAGGAPLIPDDVVLAQYGVPAESSQILALSLAAAGDTVRVKTFITP